MQKNAGWDDGCIGASLVCFLFFFFLFFGFFLVFWVFLFLGGGSGMRERGEG